MLSNSIATLNSEFSFSLFRNMTKKAKYKNTKPIEADVLTVTPEQCPNVEYILVDPPCSGSGMQNRMCLNPEVNDAQSLQKLGGLQSNLHAKLLVSSPTHSQLDWTTRAVNFFHRATRTANIIIILNFF
uniref:SAM-dependent MTase RsmB/NOP-type domain-containing protein n=1 Tax=Glossina austeni TaxID=7395 RepID=A0A1A9UNP5_GLOAU